MDQVDEVDSRIAHWVMAARPKTLPAGVAPVIIGCAMAAGDGAFHLPSAACALLGAVLIQVGTNFANDYFDYAKGTDTTDRLGPVRVTQAGLIAPATMRWATALAFLAACGPGLYIVWRGGWPLLAVGVASIACGALYTGGPYPLGYLGLGDLFVLVFFGPVAVAGTYYVQTLHLTYAVLIAGLAPGLLSVAILTVNNLRDIEQDRRAGKRTLPVRWGRTFARWEYLIAVLAGAGVIPAYLAWAEGRTWPLIAVLVLVPVAWVIHTVFTRTDGPALNDALAATGKLLLGFAILFSIGWLL